MRGELSARLEEIRNEIDRIDSDVYKLGGGKPSVPVWDGPRYNGLVNSGSFLGTTELGESAVTMWQNPQGGVKMLPGVLPISGDPAANKGVPNASQFAKLMTDSADIQKACTGQTVSDQDAINQYGTRTLDNGTTVAQALADVPSGATFATQRI